MNSAYRRKYREGLHRFEPGSVRSSVLLDVVRVVCRGRPRDVFGARLPTYNRAQFAVPKTTFAQVLISASPPRFVELFESY